VNGSGGFVESVDCRKGKFSGKMFGDDNKYFDGEKGNFLGSDQISILP
jgi:hypothetical protein